MRNWKRFWRSYPKTVEETDFLKQVEKTVCGQPISTRQFQLIISDIRQRLELNEDDVVLDLCCGNGLITQEIAAVCREVVGVDFSRPLLDVANKYHRPENVRYECASVLDLDGTPLVSSTPFNKVLMYEAMQHFRPRELVQILSSVLPLTGERPIILLGSVPDAARKWNFYDTYRRRLVYWLRTLTSREAIGTWWDASLIRATCEQLNLRCEFCEQSGELHTAHYRFDVKIF